MTDPKDGDEGGDGIPLAQMIESLRSELEIAQQRGANRTIAFGVDKVELALNVTVSRKGGASAGIKFWVVNASAKAEGGREEVHSFKLTLSPLDVTTQKRLAVSSSSAVPVNQDEGS